MSHAIRLHIVTRILNWVCLPYFGNHRGCHTECHTQYFGIRIICKIKTSNDLHEYQLTIKYSSGVAHRAAEYITVLSRKCALQIWVPNNDPKDLDMVGAQQTPSSTAAIEASGDDSLSCLSHLYRHPHLPSSWQWTCRLIPMPIMLLLAS